MTTAHSPSLPPPTIPLRSPSDVMSFARMGASFPTRLSFMPTMLRLAAKEQWQFKQTSFAINENSQGHAVYTVTTPERTYSLVCFSHKISDDDRSDRVIANAWDATFSLVKGIPSNEDIQRLAANTSLQEKGRFCSRELVLSRANKSVRTFASVVDALASGCQPSASLLRENGGYLIRTTAVYGNGKFGCADRFRIQHRPELQPPFQVEMIAVYLIRLFSLDLVERLAQLKNPETAVKLDKNIRTAIGVGNATGLGMAPFIVHHAPLIHKWVQARELALAHARSYTSHAHLERLLSDLHRAREHLKQWRTTDTSEQAHIQTLQNDLNVVISRFHSITKNQQLPYHQLYLFAEQQCEIRCQELIASLLIALFPDVVDDIGKNMALLQPKQFTLTFENARKSVKYLRTIIEQHYDWALACFSTGNPDDNHHFWYYAEDKMEPRLGVRFHDIGHEKEMSLAVARDVTLLYEDLSSEFDKLEIRAFLLAHPAHRYIVGRIMALIECPYAEVRENTIRCGLRPIDLLRFKLAFFGAYSFDPKSDLWLRINMFQGAPLPETSLSNKLSIRAVNDWYFPTL